MKMTAGLQKFALTAHVTFSVGWVGAVAAFLALAVAGLTSHDPQIVRAAYLAMELIGWFVIVPSSLAALLTGLVQSLGTQWGLFRHYWVLVKFLLTIGATLLLLMHMGAVTRMSVLAAQRTPSGADLGALRTQLIVDAGLALLLLVAMTTLSVYKPWGLTPYGRRRQVEPRHVVHGIAFRSMPIENTSVGRHLTSNRGRPWGLYVLLGMIGVFLLFVVLHLAGGGLHHH